jgi:hypothetical protein
VANGTAPFAIGSEIMAEKKFCKYGCSKQSRLCCWLCIKPCKEHCNLPCSRFAGFICGLLTAPVEKSAVPAKKILRSCTIHYAAKGKKAISNGVDDRWREIKGVVLVRSRGKGPKNVLVETPVGRVVVPFFNVKWN